MRTATAQNRPAEAVFLPHRSAAKPGRRAARNRARTPRCLPPTAPQGRRRDSTARAFFRAAVLAGYDHRCALTGLDLPELIHASHIIPWADNVPRRADPTNGIALNVLHDRAFDRGLITFSTIGSGCS